MPSGALDFNLFAFCFNSKYATLSCIGICLIVWRSLLTAMRAATRAADSRTTSVARTTVTARRIQMLDEVLVSVAPIKNETNPHRNVTIAHNYTVGLHDMFQCIYQLPYHCLPCTCHTW